MYLHKLNLLSKCDPTVTCSNHTRDLCLHSCHLFLTLSYYTHLQPLARSLFFPIYACPSQCITLLSRWLHPEALNINVRTCHSVYLKMICQFEGNDSLSLFSAGQSGVQLPSWSKKQQLSSGWISMSRWQRLGLNGNGLALKWINGLLS